MALAFVGCALPDRRRPPVGAAPRKPRPPQGIPPRAPGLAVDPADAAQARTLAALRSASDRPLSVRIEHGQPRSLAGSITLEAATPAAVARLFAGRYAADLWRLGPNSGLVVERTDPGTGVVVLSQRYRGLPVLGGELSVLVDGSTVHGAIGTLMPGDGLDITPVVTETEARRKAGGALLAPARLAVSFVRPPSADAANPPEPVRRLVWMVPIARPAGASVAHVDARTGAVVGRFALEQDSAAALDEYEAEWYDANSHPKNGELCQGDVDDVDFVGDDDGLDSPYAGRPEYNLAWSNTRRGYVFYYDRFGRLSYDGSDGPLLGYNESGETDNAFWSSACEEISWAVGYGSSDTPVHEMTHGVTQFTSGLVYQDESGALNESFSDVMAAVADPDADPWLHGEDKLGGGGPTRNLMNPSVDFYGEMTFPSTDNGKVHTNSGVGNKAAFLLSEGGIHPDTLRQVTGIGRPKTGRIVYAAGTSLGAYDGYEDLRDTAVVFGSYWAALSKHGFTLANVCSVRNAYAAVGVGKGDADCDGIQDDQESDNDADGVADGSDNCTNVANPGQTDTDDDEDGDACDSDDDDDTVADTDDNCPTVGNAGQADLDGDGIGNACDDSDGDGVLDTIDNCADDYNPGQEDSNGDGFYGDACDPDEDHDGVPASDGDNCPKVYNPSQADGDGDFYGDACDACPTEADPTPAFGFNGMPLIDDSDGDGKPDECDPSFRLEGRPWSGALQTSRVAQPATVKAWPGHRVAVPVITCPSPCIQDAERPFFSLDLDPLPTGIRVLVTDEAGQAWARSQPLPDGGLRLRWRPRGDRRYFLAFQSASTRLERSSGADRHPSLPARDRATRAG